MKRPVKPKMTLGARELKDLVCPPGDKDLMQFDKSLRGFGVRVTADGAKLFIFQYRRGKAVRRLRLGPYGSVTPARARKLAEQARAEVAAGRDPVAERAATIAAEEAARAARLAAAEADTFTLAKLIDTWEDKQLRHRSQRYASEAARALRYGLRGLLQQPAHALTSAAVQRALDAIPKPKPAKPAVAARQRGQQRAAPLAPADAPIAGHAMARRTHAYGRALYRWAGKRGLVTVNPFEAAAAEGREVRRERVLSDAELGEVWRAAGGLGWPWGPYLRFLLLTLQREAEVAGLRWAELATDAATGEATTWQLPGTRSKNGRAHLVQLAAPARAILVDARQRGQSRAEAAGAQPSPLVFTTTGNTAISGFSNAKERLDAAIVTARAEAAASAGTAPAPLVPWRLHDFRRSGVTVLARLGVRWEVADKLLNHATGAISGVAAVYQRHDFLVDREAALAAWATHVLAMAERLPQSGHVVALPPRRQKLSSQRETLKG